MGTTRTPGFTLIELLVVITIIVVLLALLMPALDKAIYQAELAVCGARKRSIASATVVYANAHQRLYPARAPKGDESWMNAIHLNNGGKDGDLVAAWNWDKRDQLKGYMDMNAVVDPLAKSDLDLRTESNSPGTFLLSNYPIYSGAQYTGKKGMRRLGDRFEAYADPMNLSLVQRFALLVTDRDHRTGAPGGWTTSSHPDRDGRMSLVWSQDGMAPWDTGAAVGVPVDGKVTFAWWESFSGRGVIDTQFAQDDTSVQRYNDVTPDDPRMARIPEYYNDDDYVSAGPNARVMQVPWGE